MTNKGKTEFGEASHITTRQCGDADRKKDEVQEAPSAGQDPEATKNTARIKELSLNEVMGCMNPAVSAWFVRDILMPLVQQL